MATLFPESVSEECRLVFVGYFDDSGTHQDSEFAVVGGFLGSSAAWLAFETKWQAILKRNRLSAPFRMSQWSNRAPPFHNWSEEKRRDLFNQLIGVIAAHSILAVGVALPTRMYRELSAFSQAFTSPYGLATQLIFGGVKEIIKEEQPDAVRRRAKVAYVFEVGAFGSGGVKQTFDDLMNIPPLAREYHLASLAFVGKHEFMQLQAADIVAYELYREAQRLPSAPRRYPILELEKYPYRWLRVNHEEIRKADQSIKVMALRQLMRGGGRRPIV
jgi:hypothetical protein